MVLISVRGRVHPRAMVRPEGRRLSSVAVGINNSAAAWVKSVAACSLLRVALQLFVWPCPPSQCRNPIHMEGGSARCKATAYTQDNTDFHASGEIRTQYPSILPAAYLESAPEICILHLSPVVLPSACGLGRNSPCFQLQKWVPVSELGAEGGAHCSCEALDSTRRPQRRDNL
jgi:hypothetical protein